MDDGTNISSASRWAELLPHSPGSSVPRLALRGTVVPQQLFADQNQMIHFLKNVMMAGGLLQIAAFGAGAFSIDNQRKAGGIGSSLAASA
jgi:putative oxidoreductase